MMIDFQRETLDRLARIEAALGVKCDAHSRDIQEIKDTLDDHETRLRPLETQRSRLTGIAVGSGLTGSLLIKFCVWLWGAR